MELPVLSVDNYAAICLVIATPWLYQTFRPFSSPDKPNKKSHIEQAISVALLVHTMYMLWEILVSPPQNIFTALGLGLDVPPEVLKVRVAEMFGGEENVPGHLGLLLKRLGLSDLRLLYVRFGHNVLTTCSYCHSYSDFALYAFPGALLEYIREIAFVGLLTLPKSITNNYRPLGLGALLVALMAEAYWTLTVPMHIPSNAAPDVKVTMWHDLFIQLRHTLFLILPLFLRVLPSLGLHRLPIVGAFFPSPDPQRANLPPAQFQMQGQNIVLPDDSTLMSSSTITLQTLSHLVPTLHLLKYAHAAVMRSQSTPTEETRAEGENAAETKPRPAHTRASQWWAEEAREGKVLREDEGVKKVLKAAGLSVEPEVREGETVVQPEGQLLVSAKMAVNFLKEQGSMPSGLWMA